MAQRPIIAVDVDDVLAASAVAWVKHSNERWDTNLTVQDYVEDWAAMWQLDHVQTKIRADELFAAGLLADFEPEAEAFAVLTQLAETYELVVATSRRSTAQAETLAWLDKHFNGIFANIHMSGIYDASLAGAASITKSELVKHIGADYLIDDQLKHCLAVAEDGVQAVLFGDYAWNQTADLPERVTRCVDWAAVGEFFDGQRRTQL